MTIGPDWEERSSVLKAAAAAGFDLSGAQLSRLHRAGAIFDPERRALGRGAGRPSWYPPGTTARVVRLLELAPAERRLAQRAWLIWWEDGGPLVPVVRRTLLRIADRLDEQLQLSRRLARGQADQDADVERDADELFVAAESGRLQGTLGQARRRAGRTQFPTVLQFLIEVAGGTFEDFSRDGLTGESLAPLVESALGFERARVDKLGESGPWLEGDLAPDFAKLSRLFAELRFEELAGAADDVLDQARAEVQAFVRTVTVTGEMLERLFGRGAFSYGTFARQLRLDSLDTQAFLLLGWLQLGTDPQTLEGMKEFAGLESEALQGYEQMQKVDALRQVPGFESLLAPEAIAAALTDTRTAEELEKALGAARKGREAEIQEVLNREPPA